MDRALRFTRAASGPSDRGWQVKKGKRALEVKGERTEEKLGKGNHERMKTKDNEMNISRT